LHRRRDRRHGLPIENPLLFYAKYWGGSALKFFKYARVYLRFKAMLDRALKAEDRWTYSDLAVAPPKADEFDTLEMYHATAGGEEALKRKKRDEAIRAKTHAHDAVRSRRWSREHASGASRLDTAHCLQPGARVNFALRHHRRLRAEALDDAAHEGADPGRGH